MYVCVCVFLHLQKVVVPTKQQQAPVEEATEPAEAVDPVPVVQVHKHTHTHSIADHNTAVSLYYIPCCLIFAGFASKLLCLLIWFDWSGCLSMVWMGVWALPEAPKPIYVYLISLLLLLGCESKQQRALGLTAKHIKSC